jgi:uncharacterized protein (DUF433 family)
MATAAKKATYPHIEITPDVRAGKPCIAGTRIAVVDIAIAHQQGIKPEKMLTYFSSRPLTLAEVHAALAYHYDHPEELEDYLRRSEKVIEEIEAAKAEYLRRKARP